LARSVILMAYFSMQQCRLFSSALWKCSKNVRFLNTSDPEQDITSTLQKGTQFLLSKSIENPALESRILLEHTLQVERNDLRAQAGKLLNDSYRNKFQRTTCQT